MSTGTQGKQRMENSTAAHCYLATELANIANCSDNIEGYSLAQGFFVNGGNRLWALKTTVWMWNLPLASATVEFSVSMVYKIPS